MLKLDTGINTTEKDLIQAKVEAEENFNELRKKEKELEKRLEHVKESEKRMTEDRHKLQELDDKIKLKSIRAEKTLKVPIHLYLMSVVVNVVFWGTVDNLRVMASFFLHSLVTPTLFFRIFLTLRTSVKTVKGAWINFRVIGEKYDYSKLYMIPTTYRLANLTSI